MRITWFADRAGTTDPGGPFGQVRAGGLGRVNDHRTLTGGPAPAGTPVT